MTEEEPKKEFSIFGKNIAEIPCFRDSYLYGICTGIVGGLGYFMCTSRPQISTHFGVASFAITTLAYWTYCRNTYNRKTKEAQQLQAFLKDQIMKEGVGMGDTEDITFGSV